MLQTIVQHIILLSNIYLDIALEQNVRHKKYIQLHIFSDQVFYNILITIKLVEARNRKCLLVLILLDMFYVLLQTIHVLSYLVFCSHTILTLYRVTRKFVQRQSVIESQTKLIIKKSCIIKVNTFVISQVEARKIQSFYTLLLFFCISYKKNYFSDQTRNRVVRGILKGGYVKRFNFEIL